MTTSYPNPTGAGKYSKIDLSNSSSFLYGASGKPQVTAVSQGTAIGDCWFLSALADVAVQNPSAITSMIKSDGNGIYSVTFHVGGKTDTVTVNDQLAANANAARGNGNWASLIEKAYAVMNNNSYTAISGGQGYNGIYALTGQTCGVYASGTRSPINQNTISAITATVRNTLSSGGEVCFDSNDLFIPQTQTAGHLTGSFATFGTNSSTGQSEGYVVSLGGGHTYSVVGYDTTTGNFIVRNPWGYDGKSYVSTTGVRYPNAIVASVTDVGVKPLNPATGSIKGAVNYFSQFEMSASDLLKYINEVDYTGGKNPYPTTGLPGSVRSTAAASSMGSLAYRDYTGLGHPVGAAGLPDSSRKGSYGMLAGAS